MRKCAFGEYDKVLRPLMIVCMIDFKSLLIYLIVVLDIYFRGLENGFWQHLGS